MCAIFSYQQTVKKSTRQTINQQRIPPLFWISYSYDDTLKSVPNKCFEKAETGVMHKKTSAFMSISYSRVGHINFCNKYSAAHFTSI